MSPEVDGGAILLARQSLESDIFYWKPAEWWKIWTYILLKVNYKDTKLFKRGTGYFCWTQDKVFLKGITKHQWHNCIKWLKKAKQITTQKTTRGIIITVCNYERYQTLKSYRSEAKSDTQSKAETKQKRSKSDTINKNDKNDKNDILHSSKLKNLQDEMRKIIEHFKTLKGYSEIENWDKHNWKRHTKPAKLLLTLTSSVDKAIKVIDWLNELYEEKNLDWTLETVIKKYPDFQLKEIEAQKDKEEVEVIKKVYIKKEEKEKVLNKKAEQIYNRLTKEQKETLRTLAEDDLRRGMKLIKPPLEERENIIFGLMINRIKNKLQRAPP